MDRSMKSEYRAPHTNKSQESRIVFFFVLISALCHGIIFAAVLLVPDLTPARKIPYPVVSVRLVSLPAQEPVVQAVEQNQSRPAKEKAAAKAKTDKKISAPKPQAEPKKSVPAVSLEKKVKKGPKQSLKHKTFKSSKVLESTLSRLKKEVDENRPPSLEKAFNRLEKQVKETDQPTPKLKSAPPVNPEAAGAAVVSGQEIRDRIRIYNAEIAYQIRKNWVFSEQLAGDGKDLETALGITVLPDGKIEKIWFDKKSGNRYLDESAYRAIMKSNPLPPLPQGTVDTSYTVGLRFGPKGLKP